MISKIFPVGRLSQLFFSPISVMFFVAITATSSNLQTVYKIVVFVTYILVTALGILDLTRYWQELESRAKSKKEV